LSDLKELNQTAPRFAAGVGYLFTTTGHINCALMLTGRKNHLKSSKSSTFI